MIQQKLFEGLSNDRTILFMSLVCPYNKMENFVKC